MLNNECGIVFFNIIMDTLNENILKFPPAKQILNTLVTHLGEVKNYFYTYIFKI